MRVIVGMSGGVDSSVTAWLLKEQGYDVIGVSLLVFETGQPRDPTSCCSLEAVDDAARTAQACGIPHRVVDVRDEFTEKVIEPFAELYSRGITPNPCILCNRYIKFPMLLHEAGKDSMIATGHYARIEHDTNGGPILKTGKDPSKDQSYVLYPLGRETLSRLLLPLGSYLKEDVRKIAVKQNLPAFGRPESQEICFVDKGEHGAMVETLLPGSVRPGSIVNSAGEPMGTHSGIANYTPGQRKGLGIAFAEPLYVTGMNVKENTVQVGIRSDAYTDSFLVHDMIWLQEERPPLSAEVKVRSTGSTHPCTVEPYDEMTITVKTHEPIFAPAPGQAAVLYKGDTVIGGGTIGLRPSI